MNDRSPIAGGARPAGADGDGPAALARRVLAEFDACYQQSRRIPGLAKQAFEDRDHAQSLDLSRRRLSIYGESIHALARAIAARDPGLAATQDQWRRVEEAYLAMIEGRYEADLAYAFINSVQNQIYQGAWRPLDYAAGGNGWTRDGPGVTIHREFPGGAALTPATLLEILSIPGFARAYQDQVEDAYLVADRVNRALRGETAAPCTVGTVRTVRAVQMIDAGFYRNRGAYLVGRLALDGGAFAPLVIALLNDENGIYVDAVLTCEADSHNIFSSTLANFHVTTPYYHELAAFLHSIMPNRPVGLHYSTIGYNHVGKVAVMNDLRRELDRSDERFELAVGFRGTVAIAFSAPSSAYTLKVIRDTPTKQYKWGAFAGVESVLDKYRRVHEINRTGSMLDNIIYYNLWLRADWFDEALREELLEDAGGSVARDGEWLVFKHLIVQSKMIPLPVFLEAAPDDDARTVIENLGHCIKNNAAANIFNKDLDGRNYGVSKHLKVYLFDYDALEPFTDIKIRTNQDRVEGEEEVPAWFFEDGVIFLPEEVEVGLRIVSRDLRRHFRAIHADLLTVDYWQSLQDDLLGGKVPSVSVYPDERKLVRQIDRLGTYY
jgi:isocitrate dehydrogenase kinase/phosphatase